MRAAILLVAMGMLLVASVPASGSAGVCPTYAATAETGLAGVGVEPPQATFVRIEAGGATFYVVNDEVASGGWLTSPWIYQEGNGRDGLQRADAYCTTEGFDAATADVLIF